MSLSDCVDELGSMADAYGEFYWPDNVKTYVQEAMAYFCKTLPRTDGTFCGHCDKCNKFKEIFGDALCVTGVENE